MIIKFEDLGQANLIQGATYEGGNNKNASDEPLIKLFKLDKYKKGIGASGGFRKSSKEDNGKMIKGMIAFVALIDTGKQPKWPNTFDEKTRIFTYYGDNQTSGKDKFETKHSGNELLADIFKKSYLGPNARVSSNRACQQTSNLCKGSDPCIKLPGTSTVLNEGA